MDDIVDASVADDESERKRQLAAEAASLGLKLDMRWGEARMRDAIDGARRAEDNREAELAAARAKLEEQARELAELRAAAEAKREAPVSNAPKGILTTMAMSLPGDLARQEEERRVLMERAMQLGIANEIRPGASAEAISAAIMRHVANKADQLRQRDELDKLRAQGNRDAKVTIRVLPLGDNKLSKGIHVPGVGDVCYARGDIVHEVQATIAQNLEKLGYAEIVGGEA